MNKKLFAAIAIFIAIVAGFYIIRPELFKGDIGSEQQEVPSDIAQEMLESCDDSRISEMYPELFEAAGTPNTMARVFYINGELNTSFSQVLENGVEREFSIESFADVLPNTRAQAFVKDINSRQGPCTLYSTFFIPDLDPTFGPERPDLYDWQRFSNNVCPILANNCSCQSSQSPIPLDQFLEEMSGIQIIDDNCTCDADSSDFNIINQYWWPYGPSPVLSNFTYMFVESWINPPPQVANIPLEEWPEGIGGGIELIVQNPPMSDPLDRCDYEACALLTAGNCLGSITEFTSEQIYDSYNNNEQFQNIRAEGGVGLDNDGIFGEIFNSEFDLPAGTITSEGFYPGEAGHENLTFEGLADLAEAALINPGQAVGATIGYQKVDDQGNPIPGEFLGGHVFSVDTMVRMGSVTYLEGPDVNQNTGEQFDSRYGDFDANGNDGRKKIDTDGDGEPDTDVISQWWGITIFTDTRKKAADKKTSSTTTPNKLEINKSDEKAALALASNLKECAVNIYTWVLQQQEQRDEYYRSRAEVLRGIGDSVGCYYDFSRYTELHPDEATKIQIKDRFGIDLTRTDSDPQGK